MFSRTTHAPVEGAWAPRPGSKDPEDEYTHEVTEETNFNESMYFNVVDPTTKVGGFFRIGNRPNEGTGEMTVCVYLPPAGRPARSASCSSGPRSRTTTRFDAGRPQASRWSSRSST